MGATRSTARTTAGPDEGGAAFSAEERAAMKERATEVKAQRRKRGTADPDAEVLAKIAELPQADRVIAERVHAIVREAAPGLEPRTWYGMPAYALPGKGSKAGKIVCFLQPAAKFGTRYATLGFNDDARLDDGAMWPTAYAVTELTDEVAARIREAVTRAVS